MSAEVEIEPVHFPLRVGDRIVAGIRVPLCIVNEDFLDVEVDRGQKVEGCLHIREALGVVLYSVAAQPADTRFGLHGRLLRYVPRRFPRHFTPIEGTFEAYQAHFSSKTRSGLRRKVRKFAEHFNGEIAFRVYEDAAGMDEFHRLARQVSAATYQERLFDDGLPQDDAFRAQMVDEAEAGRAIGFLLLGAGQPVAYIYCPVEGRRIVYRYVGFDAAHGRLSPGTVLQWLALEHLFEHRAGYVFDFTEGEGDHKAFFGTDSVECANVYYLRPSLRGCLAVLAHECSEHLNTAAGWLLERLRLKRLVKSFIRRGAAADPT